MASSGGSMSSAMGSSSTGVAGAPSAARMVFFGGPGWDASPTRVPLRPYRASRSWEWEVDGR
eukprot:11017814-Prorocentrum_lima.AAC.1